MNRTDIKPREVGAHGFNEQADAEAVVEKTAQPAPAATDWRRTARPAEQIALQQLREIIRGAHEQLHVGSDAAGISSAQAWALAEIARAPGLIVSELGKTMAIHPSTTSNMLDKMQKRGLIRRERIDDDHRVVHLFVTPVGERLLAQLPASAPGVLPEALAQLDDNQIEAVNVALSLILEKMDRPPAAFRR